LRGGATASMVALLAPRPSETAIVAGSNILGGWTYQLPDLILATLMYVLAARILLGLIVAPESSSLPWRLVRRVSDPFVAMLRPVTPKAVPPSLLWLFGVVWLFWLRSGLLYLFLRLSSVPPAS